MNKRERAGQVARSRLASAETGRKEYEHKLELERDVALGMYRVARKDLDNAERFLDCTGLDPVFEDYSKRPWQAEECLLKAAIDRLRGKLASLRTCRQG